MLLLGYMKVEYLTRVSLQKTSWSEDTSLRANRLDIYHVERVNSLYESARNTFNMAKNILSQHGTFLEHVQCHLVLCRFTISFFIVEIVGHTECKVQLLVSLC